MDIATVYGTAARPGRLWTALEQFGAALSDTGAHAVDLYSSPIDWADGRPLEESSTATRDAVGVLTRSSAVVLFAPVYRAAMPGVLKNLLDLTPLEALQGKVLGLVAMGASPHHYLAVDYESAALRPGSVPWCRPRPCTSRARRSSTARSPPELRKRCGSTPEASSC